MKHNTAPTFSSSHDTENNILNDKQCLDEGLDCAFQDLVRSMIHHDPKKRIKLSNIQLHPYFWPSFKKLYFVSEFSDYIETFGKPPFITDFRLRLSPSGSAVPSNFSLTAPLRCGHPPKKKSKIKLN